MILNRVRYSYISSTAQNQTPTSLVGSVEIIGIIHCSLKSNLCHCYQRGFNIISGKATGGSLVEESGGFKDIDLQPGS